MTVLETERLRIRPWRTVGEASDRLALERMATDPDMMRYVTHGQPWSHARIDAFFDRQSAYLAANGLAFGAVELRDTDDAIGLCGIQPLDSGHFELGWWIWKTHWGRGYATEAGRAVIEYARYRLGLEQLFAVIDPPNAASIRVAEKLGLSFIRHLRASETRAERDDKPVVLYGVRFDRSTAGSPGRSRGPKKNVPP